MSASVKLSDVIPGAMHMNIDSLEQTLIDRFPVFAEMPADKRRYLLDKMVLRRERAGTVMFDAAQPCTGFPLLLEGTVRVLKVAPNGREILLYRVGPGEGCILSGGCLLGHSEYSARGIAEDDVTLLIMPPVEFGTLIVEFEPFRAFVFGMYGARLAEVMELVEEVAFRKLDSRLAQLLIHRGPIILDTQQRLADELGSVREVVSRVLRSFEDRGWLKIERERLTLLDLKALLSLAQA